MTTQAVVVGGHTLTGDILNLQWGGEDLTGVMTAEIIAISEANEWGGDFEVKDAVDINVGGDDVFNGYVEDVEPYRHPDYVDLPCVKIKCINDGRDLVKQYIDEEYQDTKLDDLVEDALGKITTSITYTSPNSAPTVSRTFKKGFLAREFRELCEEQNYSFYVANDHAFHLFPVGDSDEYLDGNGGRADVDLDSIANNSNNIIQFRKGERRGSTLYNYVEVMSGYLDDHWTEENPSDFTGTNCTPSIETSTYLAGRSAIKVTRNNGTGIIILDLDINNGGDGRYEYTALDFSKKSVGWYLMRPNCTMTGGNRAIRFRLTDDAGTIIQYIRGYHDLNPRSNLNATDRLDNDEWTRVEFPYGLATTINSSGSNNEGWQYVSGSNFDWEHVYKLSWRGFGNVQEDDYFILDGLRLPSIEVKCIKQDATSISANGKRMLPKRRVDIKSQVELDAIATSMIEKYKNPMQTLRLTVIGNTDILYPGQSLDVNAPPYGIASDTKYRIQSVKHIVSLKANAEERDYDYITKLELISHTVAATTQYTTPWRHQNPLMQQLWDSRDYLDYLMKKESDELWQLVSWAIISETPYGTSFPSDPSTGQRFVLTTTVNGNTPGIYFYDGSDWIKQGAGNLDDILDGETYGNRLHDNIHETYFKFQHCKFEGEEISGSIVASPGYSVDFSPSYIKATTDNDINDNVIFTVSGTAFSIWPSVSQHPYSFRTRVRFNRPTTSFEMFLMMGASNGATNGAFGWWIPPSTGKLTRFWTKGGVWTTSESITLLRNRWYTLSAFFDETSGIAFQRGNDPARYSIQDDTLTIDGDINPMWIQIQTKAAQTATLEISYWSSILDWREI